MEIPLALLCFLALFRNVFGCPCDDDCKQPAENSCSEGLNPLCEQNGDVCVCACVVSNAKGKTGVVSKAKGKSDEMSLNIQVNSKAAGVLKETGNNLTIYKGYIEGIEANFNTAWYVVENSALITGEIEVTWRTYNKAAFVKEAVAGSAILQENSTKSDQFAAGEVVVYNSSGGWSGPSASSTAFPPDFEVQYDLANCPMHLVLLAPTINIETETEEWTPYFYDEYPMDEDSSMVGQPSTSLYVQPTRYVTQGSFTGSAYNTGKKIDYEDTDEMSICISTSDSTSSKLAITVGTCAEVENSGIETA